MPTSMDELSPGYIGEDRIVLSLQFGSKTAAFSPLTLLVNYDDCAPDGVVLPLEMIVRGPGESSYQRRVYTRTRPPSIVIKPREGGIHCIVLREVAHNRWWGKLNVTIQGQLLGKRRVL
jgi:hypothetical protein